MRYKKFELSRDYERVIAFLAEQYRINRNMVCWLPQRFDDLIFRVDTLYHDERRLERSRDYTFLFESNGRIDGLLVPDGDSMNTCIRMGHEELFAPMLELAERELLPLFERSTDGSFDFLAVSHDSLAYQGEILRERGYTRDAASDFDNVQHPLTRYYPIHLPEGFRQVYGEGLSEHRKAKACHYGFHAQDDDGILTGDFREGTLAYQGRKDSRYFGDSFESLIVTDFGDICSYCFCYVDRETRTALLEPLCTRERYRRRGFARQMLYGVMNRLKEREIESCFINSYDWRRRVYNACGFETVDSIGFWHKTLGRNI